MLTSVTQSCTQINQLIEDFKVIEKAKAPAMMDDMTTGPRMGGGMGNRLQNMANRARRR